MKEGKILIVDDNRGILESLEFSLKHEFEEIHTLDNPNKIPHKLKENDIDILLLDMNYSTGVNDGQEGLFWLKMILEMDPSVVIILITAYGDVELAVRAIKEGATDFIIKPWDTEKLIATLKAALKLRKSEKENLTLRSKQEQIQEDIDKKYGLIIGNSDAMRKVLITVDKVAKTDANVLILGENGTGKEMIAREIHRKSLRKNEMMISVDIGSLSESLFESELFGHVKGSFTDAKQDRVGRFETASGSTLFLDEIGNLSISLQSKLLAALQNREIYRIGASRPTPIDIRLVSATNKDLYSMINDQVFREDLLYRINTIQIELPPLRERGEDVILLAEFFLRKYARKYEKNDLKITSKAFDKLMQYNWPGNIRELQHTVEKTVILSESSSLTPEDFFFNIKDDEQDINASLNLEEVEKIAIQRSLKKCRGNMSQASKELGITRTTLYKKLEKYEL